ncbi:universal stress protein [Amycolatopsis acidicola]|uniref:Universal stress protein n=1 Tax=Amycolatopsis acidicola TaxID=2596893 RepID=A0A5N0V1E3_9PSEU|nr:universal stress protein [Amycolatopsis acidicola]KAA9160206.1 universal stress protein [Amycolatopsis acidicola]
MRARDTSTDAIVVGVDGSEQALRAVRWAAAEAESRNLRMHLVSGCDSSLGFYGGGLPVPPDSFDAVENLALTQLADAERAARDAVPGVAVTTERAWLAPIPLLLECSASARIVVLGASGHGGYTGMLTGSTAVSVVARGSCPVVVVRPERVGPVVAGVDGSPNSVAALGMAFDEASWRGVPLVAVHAWSDADYVTETPVAAALLETEPTAEEQARILAESLAGWPEKYPEVRVERVVVKDRPRHQLLARSAEACLVVVGSRGRGGFQGLLLGSTSQALIHHARCPVMIVRPREAVGAEPRK